MDKRRATSQTALGGQAAERFRWALQSVFGGSQTDMASALECSQSMISRIVTGRREPGPQLLNALANYPALVKRWVLTGEGKALRADSLDFEGEAALPVALKPFIGLPFDRPELLEELLYPTPRSLCRRSRYWVRAAAGHPLVNDEGFNIAAGDMVLVEPDSANWPMKLRGTACLVRIAIGNSEQLLWARNLSAKDGHGDTRDYDFLGQRPSDVEDVNALRDKTGRHYLAIDLGDSKSIPKSPVEVVAVAIFRCGSMLTFPAK